MLVRPGSLLCAMPNFPQNAVVFYLHEGATVQNVIIGTNQAEGVRKLSEGHLIAPL